MPYYLKFTGISGTTTNPKYIGSSLLTSFTQDQRENEFRFTKKFDKATHALWDAISSGETVTSARMVLTDQKGKVMMKAVFSDVQIWSYQDSGDGKERIEYYGATYGGFHAEYPQ